MTINGYERADYDEPGDACSQLDHAAVSESLGTRLITVESRIL